MRDFISKYPDHTAIADAYQTIAQIQISKSKPQDAIATYAELVEKHGQDPKAAGALLNLTQLWHRQAEAQGPYLAMNEQQRDDWNKAITSSLDSAEKLLTNFPNSPQVALALQEILADQKLLASAKVKTQDDITKYFEDLAQKFEATPATKSKVLFTLAAFTYEKDKDKAVQLMNSAFDSQLVYAPADLDMYGAALIEQAKYDEAQKVYEKLAQDYPTPAGVNPAKAPYQVQEAQAMALYGLGRVLQKQGKVDAAAALFDQLKKTYPWSPKLVEANFGIAESLHKQGKEQEAIDLLVPVIRANNATAELRAAAMLLLGDIQNAKGDMASAIDDYIKVAVFYPGVPTAAAEGLWKGAQLLEKQSATLPETAAKKTDPSKPGQLQKAVKAYTDLTTKFPSSSYTEKAKARLAALHPAGK
jgi:TolA-binding protein